MENNYIISGGAEGKTRLATLSEVLADETRSLIEAQGLASGKSFLDVGCGGGFVSEMAASIVGGTGRVTGIDFDESIIALNKQSAHSRLTTNVDYQSLSANNMTFNGLFDFVYARFLLSHLHNPLSVLQKMKDAAVPGGKIIVEDVHFDGHFCYPHCAAFDRYVTDYKEAARLKGANANLGPSLPSLFRQCGLINVGFDTVQPVSDSGPAKQMAILTLGRISASLLELEIETEENLSAITNDLQTFTDDNSSIMSLPRIFRVWGTKA